VYYFPFRVDARQPGWKLEDALACAALHSAATNLSMQHTGYECTISVYQPRVSLAKITASDCTQKGR